MDAPVSFTFLSHRQGHSMQALEEKIANAKFVIDVKREDGSPSFVLFSRRDIAEAATDLFRDAARCLKPVPTVLPVRVSA